MGNGGYLLNFQAGLRLTVTFPRPPLVTIFESNPHFKMVVQYDDIIAKGCLFPGFVGNRTQRTIVPRFGSVHGLMDGVCVWGSGVE